jgi:hypothetical protein
VGKGDEEGDSNDDWKIEARKRGLLYQRALSANAIGWVPRGKDLKHKMSRNISQLYETGRLKTDYYIYA